MGENSEKPNLDKPGEPLSGFGRQENERFIKTEVLGGFNLETLAPGEKLEVTTESRVFIIERRPDGFYISGHPEYCPEPKKLEIRGSRWARDGSMIMAGFVGRDMFLEFQHPTKEYKNVTTSKIVEVKKI